MKTEVVEETEVKVVEPLGVQISTETMFTSEKEPCETNESEEGLEAFSSSQRFSDTKMSRGKRPHSKAVATFLTSMSDYVRDSEMENIQEPVQPEVDIETEIRLYSTTRLIRVSTLTAAPTQFIPSEETLKALSH